MIPITTVHIRDGLWTWHLWSMIKDLWCIFERKLGLIKFTSRSLALSLSLTPTHTVLFSPCWVSHHIASIKGVDGCGQIKCTTVPREDGHPAAEQHLSLNTEVDTSEEDQNKNKWSVYLESIWQSGLWRVSHPEVDHRHLRAIGLSHDGCQVLQVGGQEGPVGGSEPHAARLLVALEIGAPDATHVSFQWCVECHQVELGRGVA